MDNDNKLVQKAADLYRSLRFSMKYRGLTILSAEAGNDAIAAAIAAGAPYMAARCGATEMRTVADYLRCGGVGFAEKTRQDIQNLSGVSGYEQERFTLDTALRIWDEALE